MASSGGVRTFFFITLGAFQMFEANRDLSLRIHITGKTRQSNIGFHRKLRFNHVFDKLGKIDK